MTFLREVDADGIVHRLQRDVLGNLRVRPVGDFQRVEHLAAAVALAVDYDVGQGRAETEAAGDRTVRDAGNLGLRLDVLVDVHLDGFNLPRQGMAVIVREVHAAEELARVVLARHHVCNLLRQPVLQPVYLLFHLLFRPVRVHLQHLFPDVFPVLARRMDHVGRGNHVLVQVADGVRQVVVLAPGYHPFTGHAHRVIVPVPPAEVEQLRHRAAPVHVQGILACGSVYEAEFSYLFHLSVD